MAKAYFAVGVGSDNLHLAIFDLQPFNALPASDLPDFGDLCGLGGIPDL
jgi:hypothetical protein